MDGYLTIGTDIDDSEFDAQIEQIENKLNDLKSTLQMASENKSLFSKSEIIDMKAEVEKLTSKLNKLKKKQSEKNNNGFDGIKEQIDSIGKSTTNTIKKIGKWALAIFSLRTAYGAVSRVISLVSRYNEQIETDLEYMQYAIATGLQSVVQNLVNVMYKLLIYVNEMLKAWFNIDLFANSSANNFKKAQKSAEGTKKALAGFDTANVLQDNSNSNTAISPSNDLSAGLKGLGEEETPKWLNNIIEFGKWVIDNWLEVIGLLSLSKLVIDLLTGNWIGALIDFIIFIISQMPRLWDAIKVVWDSIVSFFSWIMEMLNDISKNATKFVGDCISWIVDKVTWLFTHFDEVLDSIGNAIGICVQFIIDLVIGAVNGVFSILGTIGNWIYDNLIKPVGDFFIGLWNNFKDGASNAWEGIKSIFGTVGQFFKDTFENAWNGVKKIFSSGGKIFNGIKEGIADTFKTIVNTLIKGINTIISMPFNQINKMLNKIRNTSFLGVSPFKGLWNENPLPIPKINYLKNGGIVDVPRTGVPIASNTIAGEAGPEAVLPLNEETYSKLGQAIARYIVLNIDLTGKIDSRILFRLLEQIKAEQSFARNGG